MALYYVRWKRPLDGGDAYRDFHSKQDAEKWRARVPWQTEPARRYP